MTSLGKSLLSGLILVRILCAASTARADDPAAAEVLFQEGRRLLAAGQVTQACEKLKESFALDAMSGTLLNLAACYEQDGKTATAWARFRNAASLAKSQGKAEQMAEANRRVKALEADLSYLTIVVPEPVPGLEVRRNDLEVTPASFGIEVPVDPGRVEVVASAPGYKTVRVNIEVGAKRDKKTITIPKLAVSDKAAEEEGPAPPAPSPAVPTESAAPASSKQRATPPSETPKPQAEPAVRDAAVSSSGPGITPWIIGGVGVAALATGGVFGLMAMRSDRDANDACPARTGCSKKALDSADARDQQAMVANIGVGLGLAGIATAAVWLIVGQPKNHPEARTGFVLQPSISRDAAALWVQGRL